MKAEYQTSIKPVNNQTWREADKLEVNVTLLFQGEVIRFSGRVFKVRK